jgi:hypothetical protein
LTVLSLAVECKNLSPSIPLVVCRIQRNREEAYHQLIESRNGTYDRPGGRLVGFSSISLTAKGDASFYPPKGFVGKSLVRVDTDKLVRVGDTEIYERWAQAVSSAVGLVADACNTSERFSLPRVLNAILPVVVVPNGSLWSILYESDGTIAASPKQTDECEFFVNRQIEAGGEKYTITFHTFAFSHIHFFTLKGFESFLSKMAMNDHAWSQLFSEKAVEV